MITSVSLACLVFIMKFSYSTCQVSVTEQRVKKQSRHQNKLKHTGGASAEHYMYVSCRKQNVHGPQRIGIKMIHDICL